MVRRRSLLALACVSLVAPAVTTALQAQQTNEPVEMVVRLRVEDAIDQVVFAYARDSTLLLPLGQFAELVELRVDDVVPFAHFRGTLTPSDVPFGFETGARGVLTVGVDEQPLDSTRAVWRDAELYVDADLLADLLGVQGRMEWSELLYYVSDADALPIVRRLERERRREIMAREAGRPEAVRLPTASPPIDGAAVDWAVTSATRDPIGTSTLAMGVGSQLGGGSLDLRYAHFNAAGQGSDVLDFSWMKAWPEQRWVRQFSIGEIAATGRTSPGILGLSVTNQPYLRPVEFADEILAGYFPEGWEVDVYRGGQLVGFTVVDASGHYGVNLPVRYGSNPVTLVAYGPHGEVVQTERTFEVPFQRLPAHQFEYGVSAGGCRGPLCRTAANLDLRYGVSRQITVQSGVDWFARDSMPSLIHPYVLASVAATEALSVTGEAVLNGLGRVRADFAPTPNLRVSASQTWFDMSDPRPLVGSLVEANRTDVRAFWRPGTSADRLFFEAAGTRSAQRDQTRYTAAVSATVRWSGARLKGGVFYERAVSGRAAIGSRTGIQTEMNTLLPYSWGPLGSTFVRQGMRVEGDGITQIGFGLGRQLLHVLRGDMDLTWDQRGQGAALSLSVTAVLPRVRAVSRNLYTGQSGLQGSQHVEGSMLYNRLGSRATFTNGRALGRAGVAGEVYLDENANGVRDANESGVAGVRVTVGSFVVRTDSAGQFDVWDLVPFERTVIEIDTLSVPNPTWIPALGPAYLHPTPNSYQPVSLALLQGGEVSGVVSYGDPGVGLAGVFVLLFNVESGQTTRILTFSDGVFYALGLRPGTYEARVPDAMLDRLNAVSDPVTFEVGSGDASFVEGLTLHVQRRP
jgi:hypothetical protein